MKPLTLTQVMFILLGVALMGYGCYSIHPGLGKVFAGLMLAILAAKWHDGRI